MKKTSLDLSIILVSYNSQFWLKTTLDSLQKFYLDKTKRTFEVLVVDNHSQDETVALLKSSYPWVQLHTLEKNTGFSAGNNVGLRASTGKYRMLLNSDVEWTESSNLDILLDYLDEQPEVGIATPKLSLTTGELDWACHRGEPNLWNSFTYFAGLEKLFPHNKLLSGYHRKYESLDQIHTIAACSGAALIVRGSLLAKIGLLDERFFFYAEDLDWCKRFRDAGYSVIFHPQVTLIHHKYKSGMSSQSAEIRRKTRGFFYDTMLQYYDKHYRDQYPSWVRLIIKTVLASKKGAL